MSPEQAAAERTLDGRSDIYALGAIAYEMLAGRRPFEAGSLQQLLVLQFTTEPTPLAQVAPKLSAALSDAVMRALARDPTHRWQTAGEFAAALTAAGAPLAASASPESWFAQRGLVFAALYVVGFWLNLVALTLLANAGAAENRGMRVAVETLRTPLAMLVLLGMAYLFGEFVVTIVIARRSGMTWAAVRRRVFLQPRWWQPWYPRRLRDPENVWDRMPFGMKAMRTIVWLSLAAVPYALPLLSVVPTLADLTAAQNLALPLPLRITITASIILRGPLLVGLLTVAVGVVLESAVRRVSIPTVVRLLFTWRSTAWDTPAGRRLLAAPS